MIVIAHLKFLNYLTYVYPRFKCQYLKKKEKTISLVTEECLCLSETHLNDALEEELSSTPPPSKKLKGLAAILKHIDEERENSTSRNTMTPQEKVIAEISVYVDFPPPEYHTSPLVWCKSEKGRFLALSCVAKIYLCICSTSVPSERVFSTGGHIGRSHCQ